MPSGRSLCLRNHKIKLRLPSHISCFMYLMSCYLGIAACQSCASSLIRLFFNMFVIVFSLSWRLVGRYVKFRKAFILIRRYSYSIKSRRINNEYVIIKNLHFELRFLGYIVGGGVVYQVCGDEFIISELNNNAFKFY